MEKQTDGLTKGEKIVIAVVFTAIAITGINVLLVLLA